MEYSLLTGSFTKPCLSISFPGTTVLCEYPSSVGGNVLRCKQWINKLQKRPTKPINSQRKLLMSNQHLDSRNTKFVALSRKGSDCCLVNAACDDGHSESDEPLIIKSSLERFQGNYLDALWRFSRPKAFIGTVLSVISFSLLAVDKLSDFSPLFLIGVSQAVAASFLMHLYNNGVNQLADREIDKVNKPYLPLASGEFSIKTGVILTLSFITLACWLGWTIGSWPLGCYILILFVAATGYSLDVPLLRWKKNAYLAALCMYAMLVPSGLTSYLHIQTFVFGRPPVFPKHTIFAAFHYSFFAFVIALAKDIPDVKGDKLHGVQSFAVQFGEKKVFWACIALLQIGYVGAILVGLTSSYNWSKLITVGSHTVLALKLWSRAISIDTGNKNEMSSFFLLVWQLLSAECFLLPLVR
ncbi:OLC1v1035113C1 [Oldenlandia corymbosa var. corymbosa]|uniref:OLC1v1035113C1 n=1 Tax=Oldenlandia corymbosa var. corymbosa TaxID=529605 RepID=A0AAV1CVG2_OLDCO|nr:OLC1v1035113C1 [Oldenlandia corymbosa var. corymbosa]